MRLFPAFFRMDRSRAVIFGTGEEAVRKIRLVAKTPAELVVIGEPTPALTAEFGDRLVVRPMTAAGEALRGARFAIVALDDDREAQAAVALARIHGVPVNAVDRPALCDFTVPSILDRGEIVAGIASGGAAPVLAKSVRARLEALLPQRIGELAALARKLRPEVKATIPDSTSRRRFWERALSGAAAERAYAGDLEGAEQEMRRDLANADTVPSGVVHIVGAGPGDPELLTLKALRLIQEADIVFHDRLVGPAILDLIRRDATRVAVGKRKGHHMVPQTEIHTRLIEAAEAGQRVVRLKGGDPFVFGRGGEELEALQAAGVETHVVPGISSALGCAATAGVPLTHRDHAQTLTFVTGHARQGGVPDLDWPALARPGQTVVVFMGVGTAPVISERLIAAGRAASTPVAVIENGTRPDEVRAYGTLSELGDVITRHRIEGPALLVIGDVAGLPLEAVARKALEVAA